MDAFIGIVFVLVVIIIAAQVSKKKKQKKEQQRQNEIIAKNKETYSKYSNYTPDHKEVWSDVIDIAGVHIDDRKANCSLCNHGDEIMLVPDPDNEYDKNAIQLIRFDGKMLGFIPADLAETLAPDIENGIVYKALFDYQISTGNFMNAYIRLIKYEL